MFYKAKDSMAQVAGIGRTDGLVAAHLEDRVLFRICDPLVNEIAAFRRRPGQPVQPARPNNNSLLGGLGQCGIFAGRTADPVDLQRPWSVVLAVWNPLIAAEHIIGTEGNEGNVQPATKAGYVPHCDTIRPERFVRFLLTQWYIMECGSVDKDIRFDRVQ
jgi:hypothetical protein